MSEQSDSIKHEIRFTVSPRLWKYLGWLTENSILGKSEQEVARQILTDRLASMREESYRDEK